MKSIPFSGSQNLRRAVTFIKSRSTLEQFLYVGIAFLLFIALLLGFERVSDQFSVVIPARGGVLVEGVIGFPELINPVLANSNAETDLTRLIYSGLMKIDEDGNIVPDLATHMTTSENGDIYTFYLNPEAKFHDGTRVTAEDVVFTIERIKDPASESPLASLWSNVTPEAADETTVVMTLREPSAGFIEQTTIGILPKHLWENVAVGSLRFIELANYPVGSGPFQVKNIKRSESIGIPTQYTLTAFNGYVGGRPYLDQIEISFYSNESEMLEALKKGQINATALVSPKLIEEIDTDSRQVITAPMQRVFGIFFNQTEGSILTSSTVRRAISEAIDQEELTKTVFGGYAYPNHLPFPLTQESAAAESDDDEESEEKQLLPGGRRLINADWELNPETGVREKDDEELSITISTADSPEFIATANFIKESLERIGFAVEVETYGIADLNQNVIRPRNYEVLLFGQAFDRTVDPYPFWHSSQRDDPGLNVARYASTDVDRLLRELRTERDPSERKEYIQEISESILNDIPAVFLYSPEFLYLNDGRIKNVSIPPIVRSSDRFSNISNWYMFTDKVWKIFLK